MKKYTLLLYMVTAGLLCSCSQQSKYFQPEKINELRAPAYPLVTIECLVIYGSIE